MEHLNCNFKCDCEEKKKECHHCPICNNWRKGWLVYNDDEFEIRQYEVDAEFLHVFVPDNTLHIVYVLGENNDYYSENVKLTCENCINYIENLEIHDCIACLNIPRWIKMTGHNGITSICYFDNGVGYREYADVNAIQCNNCSTEAIKLVK